MHLSACLFFHEYMISQQQKAYLQTKLMISKATTAMPAVAELECTLVASCLKGLVATKGLKVITDRLALYNGYIDDATVENGKTVRVSKDWGYTYISLG